MFLTDTQKERYNRNIQIKGFGEAGQKKLLSSSVLVIGAGGLGSSAILYLAAAGIGTLGIADGDIVDLSNLQRQILHTVSDIGKLKTVSAKEKIERLNPDVKIITYPKKIIAENIGSIIRDYDFIVECSDNSTCKFLTNDTCVLLQKPFSYCGVLGSLGQIMTYAPGYACARCVFEEPIPGASPTSGDVGILGAAAGTFGALQAGEAIKFLAGYGKPLTSAMLQLDLKEGTFKRKTVKRDKNCPICGKHPTIHL
ncbi:MAG: HesA/MoeB/ThiF family protein [Desulfobacterium sp.]|nr:HesA/MoeB/ThiF family protein [Desulfobacterium sp.]MBU3949158.1 HesA/MoeB/ThiF family protein [Pseudomonadota bacterium]MBU4036718.1 HesA/MoeB/ThiF family protein [Pseudomonadota bacterium]